MKKNSPVERLYNGIIKENPLCAGTWYVSNAGSYHSSHKRNRNGTYHNGGSGNVNLFISLLRNIIPDKVRMPAYLWW